MKRKNRVLLPLLILLLVANGVLTGMLCWRVLRPSTNVTQLYIGTNAKETNAPFVTPEEALQTVQAVCRQYTDGFTLTEGTGYWEDASGTPVNEHTVVCTLVGASDESVAAICRDLCNQLHQNCILCVNTGSAVHYYS